MTYERAHLSIAVMLKEHMQSVNCTCDGH